MRGPWWRLCFGEGEAGVVAASVGAEINAMWHRVFPLAHNLLASTIDWLSALVKPTQHVAPSPGARLC
jgi:hypothetical protein